MSDPQAILEYWYADPGEATQNPSRYFSQRMPLWFGGEPDTDEEIRRRFGKVLQQAENGELDEWQGEPRPCLAWILVMDQFSMNIHRDQPKQFTHPALAAPVARKAISRGFDREVNLIERVFYYLPLEHSEQIADQDLAVEKFLEALQQSPPQLKTAFETFHYYALEHWKVVRRFGRFPDRNDILGRKNTPDEAHYLSEGDPPF